MKISKNPLISSVFLTALSFTSLSPLYNGSKLYASQSWNSSWSQTVPSFTTTPGGQKKGWFASIFKPWLAAEKSKGNPIAQSFSDSSPEDRARAFSDGGYAQQLQEWRAAQASQAQASAESERKAAEEKRRREEAERVKALEEQRRKIAEKEAAEHKRKTEEELQRRLDAERKEAEANRLKAVAEAEVALKEEARQKEEELKEQAHQREKKQREEAEKEIEKERQERIRHEAAAEEQRKRREDAERQAQEALEETRKQTEATREAEGKVSSVSASLTRAVQLAKDAGADQTALSQIETEVAEALASAQQDNVQEFVVKGQSLLEMLKKLIYQTYIDNHTVNQELTDISSAVTHIISHITDLEADRKVAPLEQYLTLKRVEVKSEVFDAVVRLIVETDDLLDKFFETYVKRDYYDNSALVKGAKTALKSFSEGNIPSFSICQKAIHQAATSLRGGGDPFKLKLILQDLIMVLAPDAKHKYLESLISVGASKGGGTIPQDLLAIAKTSQDPELNRDALAVREKLYQLGLVLFDKVEKPTPIIDSPQDATPIKGIMVKGDDGSTVVEIKDYPIEPYKTRINEDVTRQFIELQFSAFNGNMLIENVKIFEDVGQRNAFEGVYKRTKEAIVHKRDEFNKSLNKSIAEKKKTKERVLQITKVPFFNSLKEEINQFYQSKIDDLEQSQKEFKAIMISIEALKFSTNQRESLETQRRYFTRVDIERFFLEFKEMVDKSFPQEQLYATLELVKRALEAHQILLSSLEKLQKLWFASPISYRSLVVQENLTLVTKLLENYLSKAGNYLTLKEDDRSNMYQHALKVLGEDPEIITDKALREALHQSHEAYKGARNAIVAIKRLPYEISPTDKEDDIYTLQGFRFDDVASLSSSSMPSSSQSRMPPPAPPMGPPPPSSSAPTRGKTEFQIEKEEQARWLKQLYQDFAGKVEGHKDAANIAKMVWSNLKHLIQSSAGKFDGPDITYDNIKTILDDALPSS